jgi:hypothetical protein
MSVQSLRYLKSKYLSFFSARWVSRYLGTDVSNYSISKFPGHDKYLSVWSCNHLGHLRGA